MTKVCCAGIRRPVVFCGFTLHTAALLDLVSIYQVCGPVVSASYIWNRIICNLHFDFFLCLHFLYFLLLLD